MFSTMGFSETIAEQLLQLNQIKTDIKTALTNMGINLSGVSFTEYPDKISNLFGSELEPLNVYVAPNSSLTEKIAALQQLKTNLSAVISDDYEDISNLPFSVYATKLITKGEPLATSKALTITKRDGSPLRGVEVVVADEEYLTDASGTVYLDLISGDYGFLLSSTTYVTGHGMLKIEDEISTITIEIIPTYNVASVGPSGGLIAYVNPNHATQTWKYLETSHSDYDTTSNRWSNVTDRSVGVTGSGIGSGPSNSALMIAQAGATSGGAIFCASINVGTLNDWFLPSIDELNCLYALKQAGLATFTTSSYWSSTEHSATNAWRKSFSTGKTSNNAKGNYYRYRAVRRFSQVEYARITYHGNGNSGGTVPDPTPYVAIGSVVTLATDSNLVHYNDDFLGWNTRADGDGTTYEPAAQIIMSGNVDLYPKWEDEKIVFLADTQTLVKWKRTALLPQINWMIASATESNIRFVAHEGDIVHDYENIEEQWQYYQSLTKTLDTAGINWSVLPGNHDYAYSTRTSNMFNQYFPIASFSSMTTFGGAYDNTKSDNTWHTLTIRGREVILLSLEFGPRDEVLEWAEDVVQANSDATIIVVTHAHLGPDGERHTSSTNHAPSNGYGLGTNVNNGDDVWTKLLEPNSNIIALVSGHDGSADVGIITKTDTRSDGSKCYQILHNWQNDETYPGYLMWFSFNSTHISYKIYSPYRLNYFDGAYSQAVWPWPVL